MSNSSCPGDDDGADSALIRVDATGANAKPSRARKTFNRWIARIAAQRRELADWQAFTETFRTRVAKDYEPLRRKAREQRIALLRRFDAAHDADDLSRREQARLAQVIVDEAASMLSQDADPVLVALHDRHSEIDHETLMRRQVDAMKAMVEDQLGFALEGDPRTPEDVIVAVQRWLAGDVGPTGDVGPDGRDRAAWDPSDADRRHGPSRDDASADGTDESGEAPARPRSDRARAKIAREQALAAGATQSVRETWRKLASALHPDREPDPAERERKTVLMQRVNQAYKARDLLQLLNLQIETEGIDAAQLAGIGDTRLEHYNRVLKEQSEGLTDEIAAIVADHGTSLSGTGRQAPTPAVLLDALVQDIALLRRDCKSLTEDLELFRDVRVLKAWLKSLQVSRVRGDDPVERLEALLSRAFDRASR